jgi:hypothetical protein
MSVRLGIKTHERKWAQKKGALLRVPFDQERVTHARGWSLDQISQPRNPRKAPSTGNFPPSLFELRRGEPA